MLDLAAATGRPEFDSSPRSTRSWRSAPHVWAETRDTCRRRWPRPAAAPVPLATRWRCTCLFEVADYVDFYASDATTPPTSGGCSGPTRSRCCRTGGTSRSATTAARAPWSPRGTAVVRPSGQRKAPDESAPTFGPTARLDIEAELGFVVGVAAPGSATRCRHDAFADHVFGVVGLNDWSARDIQAWEYVPLGPFLGKSFATSISPWVTPLAALDAAWTALPGQDPRPLDYLAPDRRARSRHRRRGGAERRSRQPAAVRVDVLGPRADARPPDRQRRLAAHRRPVRLRHDQRPGGRPARVVPRAELGRHGALRPGDAPSSRTATRWCCATRHPAPRADGSRWAR